MCVFLGGVQGVCVCPGGWGVCPRGVYTPGPRDRPPTPDHEADTPLLCTEGMTHACENITFPPLLLRAVIILRAHLHQASVSTLR